MAARFRHVLDRHGLWRQVRIMPPSLEFGPRVNLGLIVLCYELGARRVHRFIRNAKSAELALFMALLACIGDELLPPSAQWVSPEGVPPLSDLRSSSAAPETPRSEGRE